MTHQPVALAAPRRACLVVPGSAPEKLAKAAARGADELVIDLEDAVAPRAKDAARASVAVALRETDWGTTTVSVRINAHDTPWFRDDVAALAAVEAPFAAIVVPKVESAAELAVVEQLLDRADADGDRPRPLAVQALVETARGIARVGEIAAASPRLTALVIGYADLAASLGRTAAGAADVRAWDGVRDAVLIAARANDLQAIDGPHLGLAPDEAFRAAAERARDFGFDGKWAIHPAQIAPLVELFTPSDEQIAHARAVIEALEAADRERGQGAVALEGQMLDEAVRMAALRVLARAAARRA